MAAQGRFRRAIQSDGRLSGGLSDDLGIEKLSSLQCDRCGQHIF